MEKAGFFSRFIALFIDGILIGVIAVALSFLLGGIIGVTGQSNSGIVAFIGGLMSFVMMIVLFLLHFLYYGYFWSKDGQSIGKKLMGVKVVSKDGQPLSFIKAGLRGTIGYWISGFVFWLGFIWAAFDANGETWHDKIFGTHVVKA
jgi:uncharacterized RDD family membrane protein YckC